WVVDGLTRSLHPLAFQTKSISTRSLPTDPSIWKALTVTPGGPTVRRCRRRESQETLQILRTAGFCAILKLANPRVLSRKMQQMRSCTARFPFPLGRKDSKLFGQDSAKPTESA